MKILVTGGTGLLGCAIKEVNIYHDIYYASSKDADLTNYTDTFNLFDNKKPDVIIHLAANVGGLFKNMNNKVEMLEKNLMINYNVLNAANKVGIQRIISCLSTCIFPDKVEYPINESALHMGPPHDSNDAYAYAKRMLEVHSKAYRDAGRDYICVIPTNIYGPNDNFSIENGHVIPSLVHKCYLAKQMGEDFIVAGSGKPLRQFIYSEDLARLILWAVDGYKEKESIILSPDPGDEVSIKDVALRIAKEFDYEDRVVFNTALADGQFKKTASNEKMRKYLPDYEMVSLGKGIWKTVWWFIRNYDVARK